MVQNRRYCISPNSGFLTQIKEYESIYRAQAAIQQHPGTTGATRNARRKREEDEDEADETRFEERLPISKRTQLDPEVVGLGLGLQLPPASDGDVQMAM